MFASLEMEPSLDWIDTPDEIRNRYQYYTQAEMGRLRAAGFDAPFLGVEEGVGDYVTRYLATDDPYR